MIKNNLRITAKCHAHLQTLKKQTPAKIQKYPAKTVGGVACTIFSDEQSEGQTVRRTAGQRKHGESNVSPDPDRVGET